MSVNAPEWSEHHVIGPATKVLDGVLLANAAILVDFEENPDPYESAYERIDGILTDDKLATALHTAGAVTGIVNEYMPWSGKAVRQILRSEADARNIMGYIDQRHMVELSKFITQGGICHQKTLFSLAMLELLQDRRGIGGKASMWSEDVHDDGTYGHVEGRYVRDEEIVKIDLAGMEVCRLEDIDDPLSYTSM
jgi:hypothetical protein